MGRNFMSDRLPSQLVIWQKMNVGTAAAPAHIYARRYALKTPSARRRQGWPPFLDFCMGLDQVRSGMTARVSLVALL
jgi:hypothetical protein